MVRRQLQMRAVRYAKDLMYGGPVVMLASVNVTRYNLVLVSIKCTT